MINEAIREAASVVDVDPLLVEAVVQQESSYHADAFRYEEGYYDRYLRGNKAFSQWEPRRCSSSYGLMQVMFPTAVDMGYTGEPEGLFDIKTNLFYGCKLLKRHLVRFDGSLPLALAAYNGGPGNVTKPLPLRYAKEVLARYEALKHG